MVGLPWNQFSGTLQANHAPINRSCSGPEGGGVVERRRPRCAPLLGRSSSVFILLDYMITFHLARGPPVERSAQWQLEAQVRGGEAEPLVEAVRVAAHDVRGELHPVATEPARTVDG